MSPVLVAFCYASATVLSLYLLWHFGVQRWFWHALSIALALALGFAHLPPFFDSFEGTLMVGWAFLFLLMWGIAAPVVAFLDHHPPRWISRYR